MVSGKVLLVFIVCNGPLPSYSFCLWTKQGINFFFSWLVQKWDFPRWKRLRILDWSPPYCIAVLLVSLPCSAFPFSQLLTEYLWGAWTDMADTAEQHQWAEMSSDAAMLASLWTAVSSEALTQRSARGRHISFSRKATVLHGIVGNIEQTSWSPKDFFFSLFLTYSFSHYLCLAFV